MPGRALTVQNKLFLSFALVVGGLVIAVIAYVGTVVSRSSNTRFLLTARDIS